MKIVFHVVCKLENYLCVMVAVQPSKFWSVDHKLGDPGSVTVERALDGFFHTAQINRAVYRMRAIRPLALRSRHDVASRATGQALLVLVLGLVFVAMMVTVPIVVVRRCYWR